MRENGPVNKKVFNMYYDEVVNCRNSEQSLPLRMKWTEFNYSV